MSNREFAEILARWEAGAIEPAPPVRPALPVQPVQPAPPVRPAPHPLELWLQSHDVADKDDAANEIPTIADSVAAKRRQASEQRRLLWKGPADSKIDLHGLTANEAWDRLALFMHDAKNAGCRKVLIIHGKGHHSRQDPAAEPVLRRTVRQFLESCPYAGENRPADAIDGGNGATSVLLKEVADKRREDQRSR